VDSVEGVIERITYRSEDSGYTVAKLAARDLAGEVHTIVGVFPSLSVGETVRAEGQWMVHPDYGRQLKVEHLTSLAPATAEAIEKYLGSGMIKGVGPVTAARIVKRFGLATLDVIDAFPERLTEVDGLGPQRAQVIATAFAEQRHVRDVMLFLRSYDIGPGHARRIYRRYGSRTLEALRENPYRLAGEVFGIGFKTADRIAASMGIAADSPHRADACLRYVLDAAAEEGHVFLPAAELTSRAAAYLGLPAEGLAAGVERLTARKEIVVDTGEAVFLAELHRAETEIAGRLGDCLASGGGRGGRPEAGVRGGRPEAADLEALVDEAEAGSGVRLAPQQREAVRLALAEPLLVITGGPGTGKTTITRTLLACFDRLRWRVELAAPTGRAAKRMTEACGREARTLHRLLEYGMEEGRGLSFRRNERRPVDADVIVVDEMSMVDILLMQALVQAVRPGARLVLVGDADQLPSVGPGNILRDIIASGRAPVARLTEIFRQAADSQIVAGAHRINAGHFPAMNQKDGDFFFMEEADPDKARDLIIELVSRRLPQFMDLRGADDIQVITPMRRTPLGVERLNRELQANLNPPAANRPELAFHGGTLRRGDKVMQIRNNYDKEAFNGDIGMVTEVDLEEGEVCVAYPDAAGPPRAVVYDRADLDELVLAYATSVHKSQGSEFPAVVMPVSTQHYVMLQRNLLYTAVTRARRLVVLVGTRKALAVALRNNRVEERYSGLAGRLAAAAGPASPAGPGSAVGPAAAAGPGSAVRS
jgi:exodeoxyribonuclease V alpha subunit